MLLRPLIRPLLRPLLRPLIATIRRIFITADGTATHFRMTNAKTYPDDFEFTVEFTRTTTVTKVLMGTEIGTANFLAVFSPNSFQLRLDSFNVPAVAFANADDGKLHKVRYKRVAGVITTFFDEVLVATDDNAGAGINQTFSVDEIGKNASGLFWEGVIANPTLTDLTTSSNSESWKINQPFPITTEQSRSGSNVLIYVDAPASTRELFTLIGGDWVNATFPNLLLFSEEFDNAVWAKSNLTIVADSAIAPDGTNTADSLVENTVNAAHFVTNPSVVKESTIHTVSAFFKKSSRNWAKIAVRDKNGVIRRVWFDLENGVLGTQELGATGTIISLSDDWFRCTHTANTGMGTAYKVDMHITEGNNVNAYLGNGSSIFIWGTQLVEGSIPLDYKRTTDIAGRILEVA